MDTQMQLLKLVEPQKVNVTDVWEKCIKVTFRSKQKTGQISQANK